MLITVIRTILIYFFTILSLRMLGKRQIGELEPSELVVTIIISEVAAAPIQDVTLPIIPNLIAIALLLILEVILSFGAYKNFTIRKIFFGTPSVFYEKGSINQNEMEKQRFNLNDLMETVRNTGATSLSEIEYVIMETNGNVSVIPKADQRPVSLSDMGIQSDEAPVLSYVIIDNGHVNRSNIKVLGFNDTWLCAKLKNHKISDPSHVFCMTANRRGDTVIIPSCKRKDKA